MNNLRVFNEDLFFKLMEQREQEYVEQETGTCCFCGGPCNPCSQTCGACPRNGSLMKWAFREDEEEGLTVYEYEDEKVYVLKDLIQAYKEHFKGCLSPKNAISKKRIMAYYIARYVKGKWVACPENHRQGKILIPITWAHTNIPMNQ